MALLGDENAITTVAESVGRQSPGPAGWKKVVSDFQDVRARRVNAAFLLLGLFHHFAVTIVISGAHDIVHGQDEHAGVNSGQPGNRFGSAMENGTVCDSLECNQHSTAIVLLADVVPALLIKIFASNIAHRFSYHARVLAVVVLTCAGLLVVALVQERLFSLSGVVLMSIAMGIGEVTILSMTSLFSSSAVSYWSSGTGASAVAAAWTYVAMRRALSPRDSMLICLFAPISFGLVYWKVLEFPNQSPTEVVIDDGANKNAQVTVPTSSSLSSLSSQTLVLWRSGPTPSKALSLPDRLQQLRCLLKYMIPLFVVFYAEYLINQGLYELMTWRSCIFISPGEQYRWFQALYQLGVFISRSSAQLCPINAIWLLATLQVGNFGLLMAEVDQHMLPNIYLVFAITLFEGLLGGACYANAFMRIHREVEESRREFSLGVASIADSFGITVAGGTAIPIHSYYCHRWVGK